jgi:hypothetical protein
VTRETLNSRAFFGRSLRFGKDEMKRVFIFLFLLVCAFPLLVGTQAQTSIGVTPGWLRYLGDGSDGNYSCSSGNCFFSDEHWFSSFNVSAGATIYNFAGNGPSIIRSTGACTIAGTISNSPNSLGSTGTTNFGDFGGGGGGGGAGATAAGHIGKWTVGNGVIEIANGGRGGNPSGGSGGSGETPAKTHYRALLSSGSFWPGGGSPGGAGGGPAGGKSGNGGGAVILVCNSINFTGRIDVSGGLGTPPTADNSGGGGGGGAGFVILSANGYTANSGVINTAGGTGGSCNGHAGCGTGGSGGDGWFIVINIQ